MAMRFRLVLTAAALVAGGPAQATAVQVTARATILKPATLRIEARSNRTTLTREADAAPVAARKTLRPCDASDPRRCTLTVYDLP